MRISLFIGQSAELNPEQAPGLVSAIRLRQAGAEVTRRGYPWGMVTNGMALTPERFGRLLDAGLKSVSVSLDGFEREHNYIRGNPRSYDRALEAVVRGEATPGSGAEDPADGGACSGRARP